jgi:phosphopentomutase
MEIPRTVQAERCYIQLVFRRVIWIVLDSVGIGEMPDAAAYGDSGSDTLGNIARRRHLRLPNLCRLGLGNIKPLDRAAAGRGARRSVRALRAGLARQGHHHGPLGDGGHPSG